MNKEAEWRNFAHTGSIFDYLNYKLGPDCPFNKNKKDDIYTGANVKSERKRNNNPR